MTNQEKQDLAKEIKHLILDDMAVDVPPQRSNDDIYNALGERFTDRTLRQMPKIVGISRIADANDFSDTKGINGFLTATIENGVRRFTVSPINNQHFIGLTDTPATYVGSSLKSLRVKADETGVEFVPTVDSDEKVKISATDTTAEYLGASITVSGLATKTTTSPGANEKINLDVTIPSGSVTNAMVATMPANTLKGNNTAGASAPIDMTVAQTRTLLGLATVATSGSAADLSTGTLLAARMPAYTGDVTSTAGAVALTIGTNVVTNAKAAQMSTNTIKGNNTGATANSIDLTVAQVQSMLGFGSVPTRLYSQYTQITYANNTTVNPLIVTTNSIGSPIIPANTLQAGDTVIVRELMSLNRATGTLTLVSGIPGIAITMPGITPATASNMQLILEHEMRILTAGAAGTFIQASRVWIAGTPTFSGLSSAPLAINTTISQQFSTTAAFSIAAAGNSISTVSVVISLQR